MRDVDLSRFQFDYDETWAAFLTNARGRVYARVFGRDHTSAMSHRSLEGLAATLKAALDLHRKEASDPPDPAPAVKYPRLDDVPYFQRTRKKGVACVQCHFIREDLHRQELEDGTWRREKIWAYPPPERWGLTMGLKEPARVETIQKGGIADRAGLRAGDVLRRAGGVRIVSWGDLFFAMQASPESGEVAVVYEREAREAEARLSLSQGWRRHDVAWRASIDATLPNPGVRVRALAGDALAVRVLGVAMAGPAHPAGLQEGDVIVSLTREGRTETGKMDERHFQAWFRAECSPGDRVTVGFLRGAQKKEAVLELAK